jgi:hypothetical protein
VVSEASVVGWLFLAIGLVLLVGVGGFFVVARASAAWPSTKGTVVWYVVAESTRTGYHRRSFQPQILYEFEVEGKRYAGTRIRFGDSLWGWIRLEVWVGERLRTAYSEGQGVTVFYHPSLPSICSLNRLGGERRFVKLLITAVLLIAGGIGVLHGDIRVK